MASELLESSGSESEHGRLIDEDASLSAPASLLQPLARPSSSENAILNEVALDSPSCAGYEDIWKSRANFSGWEV